MTDEFTISIGMSKKQVLQAAKRAGLSKSERKQIKCFMQSDLDKKITNNVEAMAVKALFNRNIPYENTNPGSPVLSDGTFQYVNADDSWVNASGYNKSSCIMYRNSDGSYSQLRDSSGNGKVDSYVEYDKNIKEIRHIDYMN